MESSEKEFEVRKALVWRSCYKLKKIWSSTLSRKMKERLFIATVESILSYGCETWTLTKYLTKRLNGCYTRMLHMCLNISWKKTLTNEQLYQLLPPVPHKVAEPRMKFTGHCVRHADVTASSLELWEPSRGRRSRGRHTATYIDNPRRDTNGEEIQEIKTTMEDRMQWKKQTRLIRAGARNK